jgi:hypothetical protein
MAIGEKANPVKAGVPHTLNDLTGRPGDRATPISSQLDRCGQERRSHLDGGRRLSHMLLFGYHIAPRRREGLVPLIWTTVSGKHSSHQLERVHGVALPSDAIHRGLRGVLWGSGHGVARPAAAGRLTVCIRVLKSRNDSWQAETTTLATSIQSIAAAQQIVDQSEARSTMLARRRDHVAADDGSGTGVR